MSSVLDPTEYVISTRFDVKDEVPGLSRVHDRLGRIDQSVRGIAGAVTSRLGAAFAALAGGVGIAAVTRGIIGINRELQNAELGIASLFSALGRTDMATALGQARAEVRGLREDAAKGVGELSDYVQGFQLILSPAASAGATVAQVRELNKLALTAGFALRGQEGLRLAPLDVQQALTAGVGDRTTPIVNQALRTVGVSQASFNAMAPEQRIKTLLQAFGSFQAAAEAMGTSWDARLATFRDGITDLARDVSKPLFDRWTEQLGEANGWLERHRDLLRDMADNVGQRLLRVYDRVSNNVGGIASAGTGVGTGLVGLRLGGAAAGALGLSGGTAGIAAVLGGAIVGMIGVAVSSAIRRFPELGLELADATGGLVETLSELAAALGRLADNPLVSGFGKMLTEFAVDFVNGLTVITRFTTAMVDSFQGLQEGIGIQLQALTPLRRGDFGSAATIFSIGSQVIKASDAAFDQAMKHLFDPVATGRPRTTPEDPPVNNNNFNFNGPISVTVKAERLDDPNTVATSFEAVLRALAEYPTRARGGRMLPKPI